MRERLMKLMFGKSGGRQTALKNFAWLSASNTGSRFLKALITIYAARRLGAESYGVFSYALGLAGFFIFFKNIGIDAILTREVAKKPAEEHRYFSTALAIEIVLLVVTAFLVIFVAPLFSKLDEAIILLPFVALILILDDIKDLFVAFFRGKEKMELEAAVVVIANLSVVALGFLVLRYFPTPLALTASYAAASMIGVLAAMVLLRPFVKGIVRNFDRNLVMPMLKSAWPIAVGGFASIFLFNVDIVMLGWWKSAHEIGLYSAAQRMVGILSLFPILVATTALPVFSRFAHAGEGEKMKSTMETILAVLSAISLPLFVGGVILREPLLGFIFGADYVPAADAFVILLASIPASYFMPVLYNLLFALDQQAKSVNYAIASSLCNVLLNLLLIPRFGILGAAFATSCASVLYVVLMWQLGKKMHDFRAFPVSLKVVISAAAMGAAVFLLQWSGLHVVANVVISATAYFLFLYLLKDKAFVEILALIRSFGANF